MDKKFYKSYDRWSENEILENDLIKTYWQNKISDNIYVIGYFLNGVMKIVSLYDDSFSYSTYTLDSENKTRKSQLKNIL